MTLPKFLRPSEVKFIEQMAKGHIATGVSSSAMAHAALGWSSGVGHNMPYDGGDWGRCVAAYKAAPKHLQRKMRPIMSLYYDRLVEYDNSSGNAEWRMRNVRWPLS